MTFKKITHYFAIWAIFGIVVNEYVMFALQANKLFKKNYENWFDKKKLKIAEVCNQPYPIDISLIIITYLQKYEIIVSYLAIIVDNLNSS